MNKKILIRDDVDHVFENEKNLIHQNINQIFRDLNEFCRNVNKHFDISTYNDQNKIVNNVSILTHEQLCNKVQRYFLSRSLRDR